MDEIRKCASGCGESRPRSGGAEDCSNRDPIPRRPSPAPHLPQLGGTAGRGARAAHAGLPNEKAPPKEKPGSEKPGFDGDAAAGALRGGSGAGGGAGGGGAAAALGLLEFV